MKTKCLQTKCSIILERKRLRSWGKGKNSVALIKSLIYARVWKCAPKGTLWKINQSILKMWADRVCHAVLVTNVFPKNLETFKITKVIEPVCTLRSNVMTSISKDIQLFEFQKKVKKISHFDQLLKKPRFLIWNAKIVLILRISSLI